MSNNGPIHSTGRGGAGNIGPDANTYVDGDIVREGQQGVSNAPEYSAGRGGAGTLPFLLRFPFTTANFSRSAR